MVSIYRVTLALGLIAASRAYSHTINFSQDTFVDAQSAVSFIKFEMAATKLGMFTSRFDGFAKRFSVNYELDGASVKTARITIPIDQLDTDSGDRNETMMSECFNYKRFPDLTVLVADPIPVDGVEHQIPAIVNMRGVNKPIQLKVTAARHDRKLVADIRGAMSMNELEIPDPSVLITKMRDTIELKAHVEASE